jgi:hypothetical protein
MSRHSTGKGVVVKMSLYTVVSRFGFSVWLHGASLRRNAITCRAAQPSLQPTAARERWGKG